MNRWCWRACLLEGGLVGVAIALGWLFQINPWASWEVTGRAWAGAALGVLPPCVLLLWVLRSSWAPFVDLRTQLDPVIQTFFGSWSLWELGALSLCAGLGEEVLFRGVIQSGLAAWLGQAPGLVAAALLFGFMHPITRLYVVLAASIGLWFGWVWLWSDSLLAPVLAHAAYDFVALVWCVKCRAKS